MATVATGLAANVQAYLDKHKITILFEDLTAMLVKDLPDNPIDFLISKLQGKKKKAPAIARPTSGGTKTALSKPTAAKTSTAGTSSKTASTTAAGTTKRPASSRPVTTATKAATTATTKTAGIAKKPAISSVKSTAAASPPTKRPPTTKPTSTSTGSKIPSKPSSGSKLPTSSSKGTTPTKGSGHTAAKTLTPSKGVKVPAKPIGGGPSPEKVAKVVTKEPVTKEPVPVQDVKRKEDDEEEVAVVTSTTEPAHETDDSEEHYNETKDKEVQLSEVISQINKNKRKKGKGHTPGVMKVTKSTSEGYISDSEGEDSEIEVVENLADLEEEGVQLKGEAKKMALKLPTPGPNVSLNVQVCARCAKILTEEEGYTVVSTSTATSTKPTSVDEFESASQVVSGVSTFPQWDNDNTNLTVKQRWSMDNVEESQPSSSDLAPTTTTTATTNVSTEDNTWNGVAPPTRPEVPPTDEESELNLPAPVDYHKPDIDTDDQDMTLVDIED